MRILLLGPGGLLGNAFLSARTWSGLVTAGRADLGDPSAASIAALVARAEPDLVVNCAAHTDADAAERDPSLVTAPNQLLPGLLGDACLREGVPLIHFSSTGCYGAWKDTPYSEDDPPRPTTVHHKSKIAGEEAVRQSGCDHLIARIGWLFGGPVTAPRNFVWRRLLEASTTDCLAADQSQTGNPTDVADVAAQALHAFESGARGLVNIVSQGSVNRVGYVERIVKASGLPCRVVPGPAFKRAAPVTHNEAAVNARLQALGLDRMPPWEEAVDEYVARLKATPSWQLLRKTVT